MTLAAFKAELLRSPPDALASDYLKRSIIPAFATEEAYEDFKILVREEVRASDFIAVVGTGNWLYSLNPEKDFKKFDANSDIDVAVVSPQRFNDAWMQLRKCHRVNWATMGHQGQMQLRRNGENVYCGFISPSWIPDRRSSFKYNHKSMLNRLSNASPGRREVKILYFRDEEETVDYYQRGFAMGRRSASNL